MASKTAPKKDDRVAKLATEVTNARDTQVPKLLLQLQPILDSFPAGSIALSDIKRDIWKYDLLNILVPSLGQDFARIPQGWDTATKLTRILSQCCVGFHPDDPDSFQKDFLTSAIEHLLTLARKLQTKFIRTSEVLEDTKLELLENMKIVLQSVTFLCGGYEQLAINVMHSPWLLKMLMDEDITSCMSVMKMIQGLNRTTHGLFGSLSEQVVHTILDELVYKLSASEHAELAGASTRTLLVICDSHDATVELICTRYKGLKSLLNKWQGKGFGSDLRHLQLLLDAGSIQQAKQQRLHQAAITIQAMWKSYVTRKKIKKAGRAIALFQRSFRKRKETEEQKKQIDKEKKELGLFLMQQRKKAMRSLHFKQLEALTILPANEVNKHLLNEQTRAAIKIQTTWRGHRARSAIHKKRNNIHKIRAAIVLQRAVRKWLDRVRAKRNDPPGWQRPPGLTDERRVQLQELIINRRESKEPLERSRNQQEELHDNVQAMLGRHVIESKLRRKKELHREALLARLELDAQLIINAPSLADIAESPERASFVCHSVPIATKARQNHAEELRLLRQPWWRKLGDEYQDEKQSEELASWKVF